MRRRSAVGTLMSGALVAVGLALPAGPAVAAAVPPRPPLVPAIPPAVDAPVDPDTVLVKFAPGLGRTERLEFARGARAELGPEVGRTGYVVLRSKGRAGQLAGWLKGDQRLTAVEPNHLLRAAVEPNDPLYLPYQAEYLRFVRAPQAWDVTTGSGATTVAVLDTGIRRTHPDLPAARLLQGTDTVDGDNDPVDLGTGHATLVAGTIAAETNNGVGTAGVARRSRILPVRVLGSDGWGSDASVAAGITWAADNGVRVINLSLGGSSAAPVLQSAVAYAVARDVVVVAAAGNTGSPAPHYPAALPGVVSVGATDASGNPTYFSAWGPTVTLTAPGWNVAGPYSPSDYVTSSGTSFSAPLVAATAALLRDQNPSWTRDQVVARLTSTARDAGAPGRDDIFGAGILDVYAALGGPRAAALPRGGGDALEPNDGRDAATGIGDAATTATIAPAGDADWFRRQAPASGLLRLTVTPPALDRGRVENMSPWLQAYDANGALLAEFRQPALGTTQSLSVPVTAGQTVYFRVANLSPSRSGGSYEVTVRSAPAYSVTAVGPASGSAVVATDVNDRSEVVGTVTTGVDVTAAWRWAGGTTRPVTVPGGDGRSRAVAVNAAGTVLGEATVAGVPVPFLAAGDTGSPLGGLTNAVDLNSSGQVAAVSTVDGGRGAIWSKDGVTLLEGAAGAARPEAINESGTVVGALPTEAALWEDTRLRGLGCGGTVRCRANGVNRHGHAVGVGGRYGDAVLYRDSAVTLLGSPDGCSSEAHDINDAGDLVGSSTCAGTETAWLRTADGIVALNHLVPAGSGWDLDRATAVNNRGEIVGRGTLDGQPRAFLVRPASWSAPVPASAPLEVTATAGNGAVDVTWAPPAYDGGSAVTGYTVTMWPTGTSVTVGPAARTVSVTGLANGTTYTASVAATNAVGAGPRSPRTQPVVPRAPSAGCSDGQYLAEYFPNRTLSGAPATSRCEAGIDYGYGAGAPAGAGVPADDFSVRWTQRRALPAGSYTFTVSGDDGYRLRIDGAVVIDAWQDQGVTTTARTVPLTADVHTIVLEYYEHGYDAVARMSYFPVVSTPCTDSQFRAEYFANMTLTGTPAVTRCDADVAVPEVAPPTGVPLAADRYSVRWTTSRELAAGGYELTVRADDGIRVKVDGATVIDQWKDQGATTYSVVTDLGAGRHEIVIEYFENTWSAVAAFGMRRVDTPTGCAADQWRAEYWANGGLSGAAALDRCEASVAHDWGSGAPAAGLPADGFSARWTQRRVLSAGSYRVTVRADDGVRVKVDGTTVIDQWKDQAPTTYTAVLPLTEGAHEVVVEYYENGYGAVAFAELSPGP